MLPRLYDVVRGSKNGPEDPFQLTDFFRKPGAGEANRTPDPNLGKVSSAEAEQYAMERPLLARLFVLVSTQYTFVISP